MNTYLISQNVNNGYDTYDSAVVMAESVEEARAMYPGANDGKFTDYCKQYGCHDWTMDLEKVEVHKLGRMTDESYLSRGDAVICASFNSG